MPARRRRPSPTRVTCRRRRPHAASRSGAFHLRPVLDFSRQQDEYTIPDIRTRPRAANLSLGGCGSCAECFVPIDERADMLKRDIHVVNSSKLDGAVCGHVPYPSPLIGVPVTGPLTADERVRLPAVSAGILLVSASRRPHFRLRSAGTDYLAGTGDRLPQAGQSTHPRQD